MLQIAAERDYWKSQCFKNDNNEYYEQKKDENIDFNEIYKINKIIESDHVKTSDLYLVYI